MASRGPYVTITDRRCLATLLKAEKRRRGWNQVRLGNHLTIGQGDISKLLWCQRARLPASALRRIAKFLPERARTDLQGAVLSAEGREILQHYEKWLNKSLRQYEQSASPWGETDPDPEAMRVLTGRGKKTPFGRAWNDRGWGAIVAYNLLRDDFEAGQEIKDFERRAEKLGFILDPTNPTADRMWLSVMRVFEPIAGSPGTIEMSWEELRHTGKLLPYLRAGFKRELILLKRPSDLERAQEWGALEIEAKRPVKQRKRS